MMRGRTAATLLAAGTLLALAGCGSDKPTHPIAAGSHTPTHPSASASTSESSHHAGGPGVAKQCAWVLVFQQRTYYPPTKPDRPAVMRHSGRPIGQAQLLGCNDGSGPEPNQRVTVYAVPGMAPERAVITEDNQVGVTDARSNGPR